MGLHVRHRATDRAGQRVQRADLVDHGRSKIIGGDVQEPAAEADQVRIADLGADHDTALDRGPAGPAQGGRIAGMETAGHVRAGDHGQHRVVVTQTPVSEGLSEVGVQVDGHLAIVSARPRGREAEKGVGPRGSMSLPRPHGGGSSPDGSCRSVGTCGSATASGCAAVGFPLRCEPRPGVRSASPKRCVGDVYSCGPAWRKGSARTSSARSPRSSASLANVEPEPDTKDWTWTLSRRCEQCGLAAGEVSIGEVPERAFVAAEEWVAILRSSPAVAARREPTVWSPLEYGAHVRDVYRLFDERLALMLTEDEPTFANWDQDVDRLESSGTPSRTPRSSPTSWRPRPWPSSPGSAPCDPISSTGAGSGRTGRSSRW